MVSNETWMGSGTYVTLAPESELFLGYMPLGPTLGMSGTNKAHLIKYSLGWGVDAQLVVLENEGGEGTNAKQHFTDYYRLVPDLYTGCIAKFYYAESNSAETSLKFTAIVAGNDADAIYFHGNIDDFPSLYMTVDAQVSDTRPRGWITLESHGSTIPAPLGFEEVATGITCAADAESITFAADTGKVSTITVNDLVNDLGEDLIGKVWSGGTSGTSPAFADRVDVGTTSDRIFFVSPSLGTATASDSIGADDLLTLNASADMTGILTAGDYVSVHSSGTVADVDGIGRVITMDSTGLIIQIAPETSKAITSGHHFHWGRQTSNATSSTGLLTVKSRVLSDNWVGLSNSITTPSVDIETKQINLALGGSRNYSYQYKGIETAGNASLDLNLNHGTWLYYALGGLAASSSATNTTDIVNNFKGPATAYTNAVADSYTASNASVWVGYTAADSSTGSQNGKFHRVPMATSTLCPPVLPNAGASPLTNDPSVSNGVGSNLITYTFSESNGSKLPTFGLELSQQKGTALTAEPMVDRNTYSETVYAQLYPGCMVNSMTLSANENEECKTTLDLNVKRAFECPNGYVARMYDAVNNDTNEFKNLFNFGQITNNNKDIVQDFITPFYFSDGTISLFGQEFMKVQSFNLSITNTVTDKRYVGQYNKQIKMAVPTQRTYEISMSAQVTDRRIFDELRRESPHRLDLGQATDGSNANIQLLLTKDTGERIKLQFDDYMVSASTWPIVEDRGPIYVDFTIMPLRTNTTDAVSHWVMQS